MKKINIQIKGPSLFFKYRVKKLDEPNLLNTNVISNNELVFSDGSECNYYNSNSVLEYSILNKVSPVLIENDDFLEYNQ